MLWHHYCSEVESFSLVGPSHLDWSSHDLDGSLSWFVGTVVSFQLVFVFIHTFWHTNVEVGNDLLEDYVCSFGDRLFPCQWGRVYIPVCLQSMMSTRWQTLVTCMVKLKQTLLSFDDAESQERCDKPQTKKHNRLIRSVPKGCLDPKCLHRGHPALQEQRFGTATQCLAWPLLQTWWSFHVVPRPSAFGHPRGLYWSRFRGAEHMCHLRPFEL